MIQQLPINAPVLNDAGDNVPYNPLGRNSQEHLMGVFMARQHVLGIVDHLQGLSSTLWPFSRISSSDHHEHPQHLILSSSLEHHLFRNFPLHLIKLALDQHFPFPRPDG